MTCANPACKAVSDTPMWRKGWTPAGSTSAVHLCNACGILYKRGWFCPWCTCVYRKSAEHKSPWLGCDYCDRWVHIQCEQENDQDIALEGEFYACPECRARPLTCKPRSNTKSASNVSVGAGAHQLGKRVVHMRPFLRNPNKPTTLKGPKPEKAPKKPVQPRAKPAGPRQLRPQHSPRGGSGSGSGSGEGASKKSIVVSEEDMERAAAAAAVVKARTTGSSSPVPPQQPPAAAARRPMNEDDEEEGTGSSTSISNILTVEERRAMTEAQKASWRAKQADLTTHRKDFHGVVTYAYEGIFSWQMYGSAEAVDETGTPYTEYLMRCQWGTSFENMQPWIVAHRYKEFAGLDQKIRKQFPHMETNMPKLPKKEMFRSLDASVVAKRRAALEYYMSRVISSMPSIVRAPLFMQFLNVKERTAAIIWQLSRANKGGAAGAEVGAVGGSGAAAAVAESQGSISPKASNTAVESNSKYGIEDPLAVRQTNFNTRSLPSKVMLKAANAAADGGEMKYEESADAPYTTVDEAETAKDALNTSSLDEDQLGWLELDIKAMGTLLRNEKPAQLLEPNSKFRKTFASVSSRWPQLRATAVVGMGVDFTLIPRAMQAEEDLLRYLHEFQSLETAHKLVR